MKSATERLVSLEGLRGVAAVAVVLYHAIFIYWAYAMQGPTGSTIQNSRFEDNLFASPFFTFISGTFAVAVFFVLSGFVLTVGFFRTDREEIIRKLAAKRYLRLMLPALASVMLAWLLITLGLSFTSQAYEITHSEWLGRQWNFDPNFFEALRQGIWGIFANNEVNYNGVLWTMQFELVGSFIVFVVALLFGRSKKRGWVYAVLIALTFHTWYLGFVIGMLLADLYSQGKFPFSKIGGVLPVFLLVIGLFLGGYPLVYPPVDSIYHTMAIPWLSEYQNRSLYTTLGAVCIIIATLTLPWLRSLLSSKYISGLGKYTFSLYLVHKPVLFTFTVGTFVWLSGQMSFNAAALLSIAISLPLIMLTTYLFERYIDAPSIRVSNVFATWLLGLKGK